MRSSDWRRHIKGFTLIEMMIVITILGIIIAIAIPQLMDRSDRKMNPLQQVEVKEPGSPEHDTSWTKQLSISTNKKYKITIWNEFTGKSETRYFIVEEAE